MSVFEKYKRWNMFERRYFWSNMLITTAVGAYSINLIINPTYTSSIFYRLGVATALACLAFYAIGIIRKVLTRQEMEWKGIILDPITNKEVSIQNE